MGVIVRGSGILSRAACLMVSFPIPALYWFNYELLKDWLSGLRPKDQTSVGISFVAGGVSGMVSWLDQGAERCPSCHEPVASCFSILCCPRPSQWGSVGLRAGGTQGWTLSVPR